MPLLTTIALLWDVLEDDNLGSLNLIEDAPFYLSPLNHRGPNRYFAIVSNEQDVFELDRLADLEGQAIDLNGLAFSGDVLLAARINDCVFHLFTPASLHRSSREKDLAHARLRGSLVFIHLPQRFLLGQVENYIGCFTDCQRLTLT
jgi:hypothetical protein